MAKSSPLRILVIGSTGHGGSYLCIELCNRGHKVTGLARNPEKLGTHANYIPKQLDVVNCSFTELHQGLEGYDVVINSVLIPKDMQPSFIVPATLGLYLTRTVPFVEITRKIILAARVAKVPYFMMVGGTGSLYVPGQDHVCAGEYGYFWRAFRQSMADSESHVQYMEERLGPLGVGLRKLREARTRVRDRTATEADLQFMQEYYEHSFRGDYSQTFVKAARVTWMFFDSNTAFNWTYASPPPRYRPCGRGEPISISYDFLPLAAKPRPEHYLGWDKDDVQDLEGRLEGISTSDFARALADDAETQAQKWKHWTAFTPLKDDTPYPSYIRFP